MRVFVGDRSSRAGRGGCDLLFVILTCFGVASCGGTKLLKEPIPIDTTQVLTTLESEQIVVNLDWVIVRDGPGSWARNADWDEYLLRVENISERQIDVTEVVVLDSLGARLEPRFERKQLVKGSKETARRYKKQGITVKAGASAGTMLVAGAAVTAVGVGGAQAAAIGSIMGGGSASGGLLAASGLIVLGPALAVGGIVRGVNNSKVNTQIEVRQSRLPLTLAAGETLLVRVFFPIAPSPQQIEIAYIDDVGEYIAVVDTAKALEGLHLDP